VALGFEILQKLLPDFGGFHRFFAFFRFAFRTSKCEKVSSLPTSQYEKFMFII
jgi:uncharacterized ParB-like nuclease family protein